MRPRIIFLLSLSFLFPACSPGGPPGKVQAKREPDAARGEWDRIFALLDLEPSADNPQCVVSRRATPLPSGARERLAYAHDLSSTLIQHDDNEFPCAAGADYAEYVEPTERWLHKIELDPSHTQDANTMVVLVEDQRVAGYAAFYVGEPHLGINVLQQMVAYNDPPGYGQGYFLNLLECVLMARGERGDSNAEVGQFFVTAPESARDSIWNELRPTLLRTDRVVAGDTASGRLPLSFKEHEVRTAEQSGNKSQVVTLHTFGPRCARGKQEPFDAYTLARLRPLGIGTEISASGDSESEIAVLRTHRADSVALSRMLASQAEARSLTALPPEAVQTSLDGGGDAESACVSIPLFAAHTDLSGYRVLDAAEEGEGGARIPLYYAELARFDSTIKQALIPQFVALLEKVNDTVPEGSFDGSPLRSSTIDVAISFVEGIPYAWVTGLRDIESPYLLTNTERNRKLHDGYRDDTALRVVCPSLGCLGVDVSAIPKCKVSLVTQEGLRMHGCN